MDELIAELKSKREAMGLSVSDLFQRTRINTDFIEALEAGNFDVLPEAYVKLFLKRYAQEVKLDGDEIVRRFEGLQWKSKATTTPQIIERDEGTPGWVIGIVAALILAAVGGAVVWQTGSSSAPPASTAPRANTPEPVVESSTEAQTSDPGTTSSNTPDQSASTETADLNPSIPFESDPQEPVASSPDPVSPPAAVPTSESDDAEEPAPAPEPEIEPTPPPVSTAPEPPAPSEPDPVAETETPENSVSERVVSAYSLNLNQDLAASEAGLNLSAIGLESTQVKVTSDGDPVFDGIVDAGRRQTWSAKDRFSVEIQTGSSVRLELQDEALPTVGADGRSVRLYISRFSIWVEEIEPSGISDSPTDP